MSTFDYILIGFLAGLAIGGGAGFYFYRRLNTRLTVFHVIDDNINALRILKNLRSDNTAKAIKFLEGSLDLSTITLGSLLRPIRKERRDSDMLFYVRRAKEYRDEYPHKSDTAGFDWQVAQAFALVELKAHGPNAQTRGNSLALRAVGKNCGGGVGKAEERFSAILRAIPLGSSLFSVECLEPPQLQRSGIKLNRRKQCNRRSTNHLHAAPTELGMVRPDIL